MNIISLFSGIGAFERALEKLNVSTNIVRWCEIDKYAAKAYSILHNQPLDNNIGDINSAPILSEYAGQIDLLTYGFPCQDISSSGKMAGLEGDTRSALVWKALDIIKQTQPKVAICENVRNLLSTKFKSSFNKIIIELDKLGYNVYYDILDAQRFGVPQHRERVFIVSIRKDVDNGEFYFPKGQDCSITLADVIQKLEDVDTKYYLNETQIERIKTTTYHQGQRRIQEGKVCSTLCARDYKDPLCVRQIGGVVSPNGRNTQRYRVYETQGALAPTLGTCCGGGHHAHIKQQDVVRKLTPKEYFRLMGFTFDDVDKLRELGKISDSQLYKQAGNSIVVDVLEALLEKVKDL